MAVPILVPLAPAEIKALITVGTFAVRLLDALAPAEIKALAKDSILGPRPKREAVRTGVASLSRVLATYKHDREGLGVLTAASIAGLARQQERGPGGERLAETRRKAERDNPRITTGKAGRR